LEGGGVPFEVFYAFAGEHWAAEGHICEVFVEAGESFCAVLSLCIPSIPSHTLTFFTKPHSRREIHSRTAQLTGLRVIIPIIARMTDTDRNIFCVESVLKGRTVEVTVQKG
jgi:hypothetical protein